MANQPERFIYMRFHRKLRGYSQAGLGAAVGRSEACISRIESGHINITDELLPKLADALGVEAEDLLLNAPEFAELRIKRESQPERAA